MEKRNLFSEISDGFEALAKERRERQARLTKNNESKSGEDGKKEQPGRNTADAYQQHPKKSNS